MNDVEKLRKAAEKLQSGLFRKQVVQAAEESERGARAAATCARMGIPFPGENAATLQLFNVMLEPNSVEPTSNVEAGRCC